MKINVKYIALLRGINISGKNIISKSKKSEIISIYEMESNEECWNDWIKCDNDYSRNDKKAIEAGACKYLNFIAIVLRKR